MRTFTADRLPAVLAFTSMSDHGPGDEGRGSTNCPHCGAEGRYVFHFVCADGSRRAAMSGCVNLFPATPEALLTQQAHSKAAQALRDGKQLASWWKEILAAVEALEAGEMTPDLFRASVRASDGRRRSWLARNGYGRRRW